MRVEGIKRTRGLGGKAVRAGLVLAALAVALVLPATASATAPTVTTQPASNITSTSAFLNGTVNANDKLTTFHFDYASDAEFGTSGTYPHSTPGGTLQECVAFAPPFGLVCVPILEHQVGESEQLTNLTPNTTYHFRIEASNADGTSFGDDVTFTTNP
jgi:hypothetical protein